MDSFAALADNIRTSDWTTSISTSAVTPDKVAVLDMYESSYTIWEGTENESPQDPWEAKVKLNSSKKDIGILPQIQIAGYDTIATARAGVYSFQGKENKKPLLAIDAWEIVNRTIAIDPINASAGAPLNVLVRQNGLLSMIIKRNASLPLVFQYQTPAVSYKSILSPLLNTGIAINIAGLGAPNGLPVSRTLTDHLLGLFTALLSVGSGNETVAGSFQALIEFSYPASDGFAALLPVKLPVSLRLPTPVTYGIPPVSSPVPDCIKDINASISNWLNENSIVLGQQSGTWSKSMIVIDIALYASGSALGVPILKLGGLRLPYKFIAIQQKNT
jgi:hypothetical protein